MLTYQKVKAILKNDFLRENYSYVKMYTGMFDQYR